MQLSEASYRNLIEKYKLALPKYFDSIEELKAIKKKYYKGLGWF